MKKTTLFLFITCFFIVSLYSQDYKWEYFGDLSVPRAYCQALPINDTLILVIGGLNKNTGNSLSSCEFIDVKNKIIRPAPSMKYSRWFFKALLTNDSNVVAVGGSSTVEFYDRQNNSWSVLGNMIIDRFEEGADFISENEILIVGGRSSQNFGGEETSEIFNIKTGQSRLVANYPMYANDGSVIKSSKNKMWAFGAREGGADGYRNNNLYEYDFLKDEWNIVGQLRDKAQNVSCFRLDDGRVFASGGCKSESYVRHSNQVMIEENDRLINKALLNVPREWQSHEQAGNEVFIIGGIDDNVDASESTEIFNLLTNEIKSGPDLNIGRGAAPAVKTKYFQDGQTISILIIGGVTNGYYSSLKSIEILNVKNTNDSISKRILRNGCEEAEFEVEADYLISNVLLDSILSQNIIIEVLPNPPSKKVNIKLKLIDVKSPGYYTINITSSDGTLLSITDTLGNSGNVLEIRNIIDDIFSLDSINLTKIICKKLFLYNNSKNEIIINNPYLLYNTNFSIPQEKLPMIIAANDSTYLEICFTPGRIGFSYDTLSFTGDCINKVVFLEGLGLSNHYYTTSKCSTNLYMKSDSMYHNTIGPNPNPANISSIIVKYFYKKEEVKDIEIFDLMGNNITNNIKINSSIDDLRVVVKVQWELEFNNIKNGIYFIKINNEIYPIVISK